MESLFSGENSSKSSKTEDESVLDAVDTKEAAVVFWLTKENEPEKFWVMATKNNETWNFMVVDPCFARNTIEELLSFETPKKVLQAANFFSG